MLSPARSVRTGLSCRLAGLFLVALSGGLPTPAAAQPADGVSPALRQRPWSARWIAHPTASGTDFGVFHFRRSFDLTEVPDSFVVHVSADNRYRLFVNGTPVARGPARGDLANWHFETVDLAGALRPGRNVLAAVVWNFGPHRPMAQFSHETAFLVQGDTEREAVVDTDERWRVVENAAYAPLPVDRAALGNVYIVVGPGEVVTGAGYPWGWEAPGFDDGGWQAARPVRRATQHWGPNYGEFSGWKLTPRTIPPLDEIPQRIPRVARASGVEVHDGFLEGMRPLIVPPHSRAAILVDQTHLTTAYPVLDVSGGAGATVTLTYAEALFDAAGRKGHRDEIDGKTIRGIQDRFLPDGGAGRRFSPLWWRTYRYLQLDVETAAEALAIDDLHGVFTAYPFRERARFASDDTTLAAIWDVGWRTARLCAGETYFDCPYYEQLQYVGDTRIQALISLYAAGDDRLVRQAIAAFDASRVPEGLTQSRYPSHDAQFIPPYSLFWVSMVHDYWMHRDDPAFVRGFLTGIRGVLDWYERRLGPDGLPGPTPWWNFVDWSFPRGVPPGADEGGSAIVALQMVYALQHAADLAAAFDRPDEAARYRARAADLKEAVRRHCWDAARGLVADTPAKAAFSEHANVLAVLVDLVPTGEQAALLQRMQAAGDLTPCTYYFRFYLDRAMKKAGLGDTYVARLDPWHTMLAQGLTTFAEEPEPTRSDAHAWSASPNYELLATVCGIEPSAPGFRTVEIRPAPGALTDVACTLPHPLGPLTVTLHRDGDAVDGEVTLPDGLTGTFHWGDHRLPLRPGRQAVSLAR